MWVPHYMKPWKTKSPTPALNLVNICHPVASSLTGSVILHFQITTEIQKHNSMIFNDQQCIFNDFNARPPTSPFSSIFTTLIINAECNNNSMHVDHACILKLLKLETTSSQDTLVFWLLVVSSNYFTKFHDYSVVVFKFHDFSMHGTFFQWFPELVGTLQE